MSALPHKFFKLFRVCHVLDNFRCNRLLGDLVRSIFLELLLNYRSWSTQPIETKNVVYYMIVESGTVKENVEILSISYQFSSEHI
jgi:hypothetical protein